MSFRLFIYYSTLCGGLASLIAWAMGHEVWQLCLMIAASLTLVDAVWNYGVRPFQILMRTVLAASLGVGVGFLGVKLLSWMPERPTLMWALIGGLLGVAPGLPDLIGGWLTSSDRRGARRKIIHGFLGGLLGGAMGGALSLAMHNFWSGLFKSKVNAQLWTPIAFQFLTLGLCVGLMISLTQVAFKKAWLRTMDGQRRGQAWILSRSRLMIGAGAQCDIRLPRDGLEPMHAQLLREGEAYILSDAGTTSGTFVNGEPVTTPRQLYSGDVIQIGNCVLAFGERR